MYDAERFPYTICSPLVFGVQKMYTPDGVLLCTISYRQAVYTVSELLLHIGLAVRYSVLLHRTYSIVEASRPFGMVQGIPPKGDRRSHHPSSSDMQYRYWRIFLVVHANTVSAHHSAPADCVQPQPLLPIYAHPRLPLIVHFAYPFSLPIPYQA